MSMVQREGVRRALPIVGVSSGDAVTRDADVPAEVPRTEDGTPVLRDAYGRIARDLRVSLTDKCNLRCTYCMPAEGLDWLPTDKTLSDDEVVRLVRIAVEILGIDEVRFTGGEPLMRKSLERIIERCSVLTTRTGSAPELSLTTNGLGLDKRAAALKAAGLSRVNVSLDTLDRERYASLSRRDRLPGVLKGLAGARDAGLTPGNLCLELTEGTLSDVIHAVDVLADLRSAGVHVTVDDFGSGFASLGMLTRLPVDGVKIDRSFVTGIDEDPAARERLAAVVALLRTLGMDDIVATGVETPSQERVLLEMGCPAVQGWLYGREATVEDVLATATRPTRSTPMLGSRPTRPSTVEPV